jgi:WD40 repeat protein
MKTLNTIECTKIFYIPSNPIIVRVIGDKLITVSQDNTMSVWERESGNWLYDLTGHRDTIVGVEVSSWSTYRSFVTYSKDGTVRLWNIEDRKSKVLLKDLVIEDGTKIRTTCDKGRWKSLCLFNQRNGLALIYYKSKKNSIRKERVSTFCRYKNEHFLISSARDRSIVYRESETKEFNSLEVADPNPCEAVCVFVKKHSKCLLLSLYNEKTPILIRFPSVKKSSSAVNSPADKRESSRASSRQSTITN